MRPAPDEARGGRDTPTDAEIIGVMREAVRAAREGADEAAARRAAMPHLERLVSMTYSLAISETLETMLGAMGAESRWVLSKIGIVAAKEATERVAGETTPMDWEDSLVAAGTIAAKATSDILTGAVARALLERKAEVARTRFREEEPPA